MGILFLEALGYPLAIFMRRDPATSMMFRTLYFPICSRSTPMLLADRGAERIHRLRKPQLDRCKGRTGFAHAVIGWDRRSGMRATRWYPRQSLENCLRAWPFHRGHWRGIDRARATAQVLPARVCHSPKVFEVIEHRLDPDGAAGGNTEADTPGASFASRMLPQFFGHGLTCSLHYRLSCLTSQADQGGDL